MRVTSTKGLHPLHVNRMTDACENITFPHTPYAVGNNYCGHIYITHSRSVNGCGQRPFAAEFSKGLVGDPCVSWLD